jgi:hypothetical protein
LKHLKRQLEALESTIANNLASVAQQLDGTKQKLSTELKQADLWSENMTSAIKAGLAAAARVKLLAAGAKTATNVAKATTDVVQAYNKALPGKAGKDIFTELKNGANVPGLPRPDKEKQRMDPWSNFVTHKLPDTASADDVMKKVQLFNSDVKETVKWVNQAKVVLGKGN